MPEFDIINNRFNLLKEISERPQSPTELTKSTGTSLSNITQQLKLLEAYGIVRKEKDANNSRRPRHKYFLNQEFIQATILKNGRSEQRQLSLDGLTKTLANILFSTDDNLFIFKMFFKNEDFVRRCKAIGLLKSSKESIELFIITDHLEDVRARHSQIVIEEQGRHKKIINWSHNESEIEDGLNRKDKYFMDMLKNVQILHDPENILLKMKQMRDSI